MERECKKCGAVYELIGHDCPMRDKDFLKCDFCGGILFSWNGGVWDTSRLISYPLVKDFTVSFDG